MTVRVPRVAMLIVWAGSALEVCLEAFYWCPFVMHSRLGSEG